MRLNYFVVQGAMLDMRLPVTASAKQQDTLLAMSYLFRWNPLNFVIVT